MKQFLLILIHAHFLMLAQNHCEIKGWIETFGRLAKSAKVFYHQCFVLYSICKYFCVYIDCMFTYVT